MLNTHVRPVRDLRNNYPELANIIKQHDHVIITNNGKSESVLISFDDFKEYEEFLHYRYIEEKLAEAEAQANDPNTKWLKHDGVWKKLREKYEL
ncbi:hypothetical protein CEB3_c34230 [Peptococcaceae bacterium CEB3]|nr:hypothetical protein CEB3_c34230 [Peptococcaceae bacterium CEB3]